MTDLEARTVIEEVDGAQTGLTILIDNIHMKAGEDAIGKNSWQLIGDIEKRLRHIKEIAAKHKTENKENGD